LLLRICLVDAASLVPQFSPTYEFDFSWRHRTRPLNPIYVEDNEVNVEVMLGLRPQIELTACSNGQEAVAVVQRVTPDLVLVDRQLPDIDGLDLLERLKSDPRLLGIPMVVVSADAIPGSLAETLAADATDYLTKPLTVDALLGLVDRLFDEVAEQR